VHDGDFLLVRSMNFPDHAWGWRNGDSRLSIVRSKKQQKVFRVCTSKSSRTVCLSLQSGLGTQYLDIDSDSGELLLTDTKSYMTLEVKSEIGSCWQVRFATKDKRYLRHSNYVLRADHPDEHDKPFAEDSQWLISVVEPDTVSTAPSSPAYCETLVNRPLFIHIAECFRDNATREAHAMILRSYAAQLEISAVQKPRTANIFASPTARLSAYSLQGAGGMGMEAGATAVSMYRPGGDVSDTLRRRIEEAITVKSRGGMASFTAPPEDVAEVISKLSQVALSHMKRMKMFGMTSRRTFELELGFCEWVILPHGKEIVPHRDGGNDCDVAAIFACTNSSDVSVEGTTITLSPGEMYIFEPQKYTHSVSKPHGSGSRVVVAIRFFRVEYP
jgi:hypothetical protein